MLHRSELEVREFTVGGTGAIIAQRFQVAVLVDGQADVSEDSGCLGGTVDARVLKLKRSIGLGATRRFGEERRRE